MISFEYYGFEETCPKFKDNYGSIADVKINTVFLVYTQEQFLRFLNYFIYEFLGALSVPVIKEEEKDLKHLEEMNPINDDHINDENFDNGEDFVPDLKPNEVTIGGGAGGKGGKAPAKQDKKDTKAAGKKDDKKGKKDNKDAQDNQPHVDPELQIKELFKTISESIYHNQSLLFWMQS